MLTDRVAEAEPGSGDAFGRIAADFARTVARGEQTAAAAMTGGADPHALVQALVDDTPADRRPTMACLASVLLETLVERSDERVALAGTANLTRGGMLDFQGTLRPVLEALEEEVILLKLIGEVEPSTTRVRIGDENEIDNLRSASVVSTGYGPGTTIVGGLGVLGPTRMDYPGTIATVRAVARYVGDLLAQN